MTDMSATSDVTGTVTNAATAATAGTKIQKPDPDTTWSNPNQHPWTRITIGRQQNRVRKFAAVFARFAVEKNGTTNELIVPYRPPLLSNG